MPAMNLKLLGSLATMLVLASAKVRLGQGFVADQEIVLPGARALPEGIAPPGYTAAPLRWFGQAVAGGPNITIVGRDLDHVVSALREMNPDWDVHSAKMVEAQRHSSGASRSLLPSRVVKRQDSHTLCDRDQFKNGNMYAFLDGVDYLWQVTGWCVVDGGLGSCNRCSCSYDSGIWMCNDSSSVTHQFMYCWDMGNRALDAMNYCGFSYPNHLTGDAQWYRHDYQYSVLLAGANC